MGCAYDNREHQQKLVAKHGYGSKVEKHHKKHHHHEHEHHHHEEGCCCGHHHHHEHSDGCSCGHHHSGKKEIITLLIRAIISIILLVVSFFIEGIYQIVTLSVSYIVIAYDIIFNAFKNIIKGKLFDENFLMTLASLTALIVFFVNKEAGIDGFDGVLVILLYQIGEFFQHYAADKSKKSISSMLELNVKNVTRISDNKEESIELKDIKVDDILLVKPGETVPTDGIVIYGNSSLNTSSLTGESKPLDVGVNDKVLSGYINNDGILHIKATTIYEESTSSKVMKMINEASKKQASGERFITKFAKIYTPIVIGISLIIMFVIPLILGFEEHFTTFLYKGLSVMVISCPCALVISIPLSYFMGIGRSAKNAILVKGGSYLEILSNVDVIALDKTGTLTKGSFEVYEINGNDMELLQEVIYAFEKNSTHPIGISLSNYLKDKVKVQEVKDLINIPGLGMKGIYNDKEVLIGNLKLLKENNIEVEEVNKVGSTVYVSYDNKYLGYAIIKDGLKDDCVSSIKELKNKYEVCLISGDNKESVKEVANILNIDNYHYEKLPYEKDQLVKRLNEQQTVVYVGDGINDATCLLNADVGIAMKSLGSDIAINASDVVIMDDKVSSINKAIKIANKTMKVVKTNIILSIALKVLVMVLALIIKLPMFVAIIADVGVCLLAILNSLTIMYGKIR